MIEIRIGDWLTELDKLPGGHFHTVITSPPYWQQRDYGGGSQELGAEPSPAEYVERLAVGFDAVARVMRDDGILWLNLGDKMSERNLLMLPERVAWAMQDRGWILRHKIPWIKTNSLPQPVTDRPVMTIEQIFMFVRSHDYFYDAAAIAKEAWGGRGDRNARDRDLIEAQLRSALGVGDYFVDADDLAIAQAREFLQHGGYLLDPESGEPLAVKMATADYPGAHFATFPPALVEPLIVASSPAGGVCAVCGRPSRRQIEKGEAEQMQSNEIEPYDKTGRSGSHGEGKSTLHMGRRWAVGPWDPPDCECHMETPMGKHTAAARVLDPFGGAGTVALGADRHNRDATIIELVEENAMDAAARVRRDGGLFADVKIMGHTGGE